MDPESARILLGIVPVWAAVFWIRRLLAGWDQLERHYTSRQKFFGLRLRFVTMWIRYAGFGWTTIVVGANPIGLYLCPVPPLPFVVGRRVLIPWEEVSVAVERHYLRKCAIFTPDRAPGVKIRIPIGVARLLVPWAPAGVLECLESGHPSRPRRSRRAKTSRDDR